MVTYLLPDLLLPLIQTVNIVLNLFDFLLLPDYNLLLATEHDLHLFDLLIELLSLLLVLITQTKHISVF